MPVQHIAVQAADLAALLDCSCQPDARRAREEALGAAFLAGRGNRLRALPLSDPWARRQLLVCSRAGGPLARNARLLLAALTRQAPT